MSTPQKDSFSSIEVFVPLLINYLACVSVVLVNKTVTKQWPFTRTLTAIHFVTTFIVLAVLCSSGFFKFKKLSISRVSELSLMFLLSIVLNNLSIQHNTVGFYQTMKISVTPVVALIERFFLHTDIPRRLYPSILFILLGVGLSTITDFSVNGIGLIYGVGGVFATALYQIMSKTKQKELDCNEFQLLLYETPIAALMLMATVPFLEDYDPVSETSIWKANYTFTLCAKIMFTAFASVAINISIFVSIRRSSALTYNIVSQLKTISILVLGSIIYSEDLSFKQIVGMVLAVVGIIDYSMVRLQLKNQQAAAAAAKANPAH